MEAISAPIGNLAVQPLERRHSTGKSKDVISIKFSVRFEARHASVMLFNMLYARDLDI